MCGGLQAGRVSAGAGVRWNWNDGRTMWTMFQNKIERERDSFKMELRPTTGNVTSESTSTNKINSKHR